MDDLGRKVTVLFPHYCKVERVLKQDQNGLYVNYKGMRVPVKHRMPGRYIGIHPRILKST